MGVEGIAAEHIQRHGAMGEKDLASLRVNAGWVGLEAAHASESTSDGHADQSWNITFAASWYTFGIENRKC